MTRVEKNILEAPLRKPWMALALVGIFVLTGAEAQAHLADERVVHHEVTLKVDDVSIVVECRLVFGGLVCDEVWSAVDVDHDRALGPGEMEEWGKRVGENFYAALDGRRIALEVASVSVPSRYLDLLSMVAPTVSFGFEGRFPGVLSGEHEISIASLNYAGHMGRFGVTLAPADGVELSLVESSDQERTASVRLKVTGEVKRFDSAGVEEAIGQRAAGQKDPLKRLLGEENLTPGFLVAAFGLAVVLGMGHALAPGHGKTIVAAYLVGSKGRVVDAVFLGGVVTFTHTASVILLGLVMLFVFSQSFAEKAYPWIEGVSGGVIALVGAWLFVRALGPERRQAHSHGHGGIVSHSHSHNHWPDNHPHHHGDGHSHFHEHRRGRGDVHVHNDASLPTLGEHPTRCSGSGSGDSEAEPSGDERGRVSFWSLLTLGVTGGIVPCPDALIVLLIAIGIHRVGLGLLLIVAFSLGLATVLIAIGILMVTAKSLVEKRFSREAGIVKRLPLFSSAFIFVLGSYLALKAAGVLPKAVTAFF